jgi:two-component system NtrC family sensor kinase
LIVTLRDQNIEVEKMSRLKDEKLEKSEQFNHIGELVGELTHEVATPLGVINTAVSTLVDHRRKLVTKMEENQLSKRSFNDFIEISGESYEIVLSNLGHAIHLVNSFKKIIVGEFSQNKTLFEVGAYLEDIEHILIPKLKRSKHQLKTDCPGIIMLCTESGALSQILINLINNALIHAFDDDQQGTIKITASESISSIILEVSDDGKGINQNQQKNIFDKYFTTKQQEGGSGLGLYIVKKLVNDNLMGEISLKSNIREGSVFTITLAKE